jgi:hypothetical protein
MEYMPAVPTIGFQPTICQRNFHSIKSAIDTVPSIKIWVVHFRGGDFIITYLK